MDDEPPVFCCEGSSKACQVNGPCSHWQPIDASYPVSEDGIVVDPPCGVCGSFNDYHSKLIHKAYDAGRFDAIADVTGVLDEVAQDLVEQAEALAAEGVDHHQTLDRAAAYTMIAEDIRDWFSSS